MIVHNFYIRLNISFMDSHHHFYFFSCHFQIWINGNLTKQMHMLPVKFETKRNHAWIKARSIEMRSNLNNFLQNKAEQYETHCVSGPNRTAWNTLCIGSQFSRFSRHARGYWGSTLSRILTGHSFQFLSAWAMICQNAHPVHQNWY
jgi:hypothetical protein